MEEERTLKKIIKNLSERRKWTVNSIEEVQISVDMNYPRIKLLYKLNDAPHDLNILYVYKGVQEKD